MKHVSADLSEIDGKVYLLRLSHEPGESVKVKFARSSYSIVEALELGSCLEKLYKSLKVLKV